MTFELPGTSTVEAEARAYLRHESLDVYNRLHSIAEDVDFVNYARSIYPTFAFLPNLRCGAWYTDPALCSKEPAYFKSTDGHYNGWSFNLRRPNIHLLPLITSHGGIVLVDSTRSGKRLPDALSKTVPIWCAVINRAVALRSQTPDAPGVQCECDTRLYTPPGAVSAQEHAHISHRLDQWAQALASSSYTLPALPKPLRPFWITPASSHFPDLTSDADFLPVICVSASRQVHEGVERRASGYAYVQGAADDHELWGLGLTPQLFWAHKDALLAAERPQIEALVKDIVASTSDRAPLTASLGTGAMESAETAEWRVGLTRVEKVNGRVQLCRLADLPDPRADDALLSDEKKAYFLVFPSAADSLANEDPSGLARIERAVLAPGKKGQHELLRVALPRAVQFAARHLGNDKTQTDIVIACEDGKDASVGIAVALLQLFFDDTGQLRDCATRDGATKQSVRLRLEWVIAARPEANPSRTTLKRVNDFVLSSPPVLL